MGYSFVEFQNRTQMMSDGDIVTLVYTVLDVAQKDSPAIKLTANIEKLFDSWKTLVEVYGPGCLDLHLNEYVLTEADQDSLLKVVEHTRDWVEKIGTIIPGSYINGIVNAPAILEFYDRPTADILDAIDTFTKLLRNKHG